jgi:hypothetical protein
VTRVAAVGHSIGGVTAAEACADDSRFKGAINLDGHAASLPFLPDKDGNGPRQPLVELTNGPSDPTDRDLERWQLTREEFHRQMAAATERANDAMRTIAAGSYRVTIPGVNHASFGDMAVWGAGKDEDKDRKIQIVRDYVRASCDKILKGRTETLLGADDGPYSEVRVESFKRSN